MTAKNQFASFLADLVLGVAMYIIVKLTSKIAKRMWRKFRPITEEPVVA